MTVRRRRTAAWQTSQRSFIGQDGGLLPEGRFEWLERPVLGRQGRARLGAVHRRTSETDRPVQTLDRRPAQRQRVSTCARHRLRYRVLTQMSLVNAGVTAPNLTKFIRFYCHVINWEPARRGVRRGSAESSACKRGNAVGTTSGLYHVIVVVCLLVHSSTLGSVRSPHRRRGSCRSGHSQQFGLEVPQYLGPL